MAFSFVIALFLFCEPLFVRADGCHPKTLFTACETTDLKCLRATTVELLQNTASGMPECGIEPLDPLIIPLMDIEACKDITLHFKNLNVTGLKDHIELTSFKLDKTTNIMEYTIEIKIDMFADLTVDYNALSKSYKGLYKAIDSGASATVSYKCDTVTDDKGVEHYSFGPDTIVCAGVKKPEVTLGTELEEAIANDPDTSYFKPENVKRQTLEVVCNIMQGVFGAFVKNIRATAKSIPKSQFFLNL